MILSTGSPSIKLGVKCSLKTSWACIFSVNSMCISARFPGSPHHCHICLECVLLTLKVWKIIGGKQLTHELGVIENIYHVWIAVWNIAITEKTTARIVVESRAVCTSQTSGEAADAHLHDDIIASWIDGWIVAQRLTEVNSLSVDATQDGPEDSFMVRNMDAPRK